MCLSQAMQPAMKGFGMGERALEWPLDSTVDAAFEIERDLYFGGLGLILRDCRVR